MKIKQTLLCMLLACILLSANAQHTWKAENREYENLLAAPFGRKFNSELSAKGVITAGFSLSLQAEN